jgi:hypothetical protein
MTESEPSRGDSERPIAWTCARCGMTLSFAPEVKRPRLPSTWAKQDGHLYCLACRRDIAGEAGLEGIDEHTPNEKRLQIRSQARIAFEISRDPKRPDNQIAKACRTSTVAVRKARARLDLRTQARV